MTRAIEVRQNQVRVNLNLSRKVYIVEGDPNLYVAGYPGKEYTIQNLQGKQYQIYLVNLAEVAQEALDRFQQKNPFAKYQALSSFFEPPLRLIEGWVLEQDTWLYFDPAPAPATK